MCVQKFLVFFYLKINKTVFKKKKEDKWKFCTHLIKSVHLFHEKLKTDQNKALHTFAYTLLF